MIADLFADALKKITVRTLGLGELLTVASQLAASHEPELVVALYRSWIDHNADDPLLYAVYFNYSVSLSAFGRLAEARLALTEAIRLNPDFPPPYINLGIVLEQTGETGQALDCWYQVVNRLRAITRDAIGYKGSALKHIGRVLERAHLDGHAEEALRSGLEIDPHQRDVIQHYIALLQRQCKWPVLMPVGDLTVERLLAGISPLSLLACSDDPMLQLATAFTYNKIDIGQPDLSLVQEHRTRSFEPQEPPLRIGYLSSDLRDHAVGFLTAELYELHDRNKVEVFAYYCFQGPVDLTQQRIQATVDHWLDISALSDEQTAQRIAADRIDILVDLNGYTNGARTRLLALRPAPIIVNWLGFPGTLGSPYHAYIISDEVTIPPGDEIFYSEKVVRLRCYQPTDRKRRLSQPPPSRADAGLPADAMVYCCFNGPRKITPFTWTRWMTILQAVPDGVLWLLAGTEGTDQRLKDEAVRHGVAESRIVIAPTRLNPDHVVRYPLADLCLDSWPYGAHTTASDALWMGVPVLTCPGRSFASRVCASLVRAAGLEELICRDQDSYVAMAIELGTHRARLEDYRQRLAAGRDTCLLFDTPRLVADLEGLYAGMWQDFKNGQVPQPDLSNLDIYHEIGVKLHQPEQETVAAGELLRQYTRQLALRDRFRRIPRDGRLWTAEGRATP